MPEIRKANKDDIKKIAETAKECLNSDAWSEEDFLSSQGVSGRIFLCACDGENILGFVVGEAIDEYAEIDLIVTDKAHRRMKIGEMLLNEFMKEAIKGKISEKVSLEVRKNNTAAIEFYLKEGFVIIGERKSFYSFPKENAYVMEKKLC